MEELEGLSWSVISNKKGVKIAMVNRDKLVKILERLEHLEAKLKSKECSICGVLINPRLTTCFDCTQTSFN